MGIVSIDEAVELLQKGGVVAVPTETVYGLAAVYDNASAVNAVFRIKQRPPDNPLIVHVASFGDAATVGVFDDVAARLARRFWPGPLTLVLPKQAGVPEVVTAGHDTVAVRMPDHAYLIEIIRRVGKPLAAPSANVSGRPSPTQAQHVLDDHQGRVAVVDGGTTRHGIESTVVRTWADRIEVLRPGSITRGQLSEVGGVPVVIADAETRSASPGTRHRHYAPRAKVVLTDVLDRDHVHGRNAVWKVAILSARDPEWGVPWRPLSAATLYADLRWADDLEVDEILVHCDDAILENEALIDRLRRAAGMNAGHDASP